MPGAEGESPQSALGPFVFGRDGYQPLDPGFRKPVRRFPLRKVTIMSHRSRLHMADMYVLQEGDSQKLLFQEENPQRTTPI